MNGFENKINLSEPEKVGCPSCGREFASRPGAAICPSCGHSFVLRQKSEKHGAFKPPAYMKQWKSPFDELPYTAICFYGGLGVGFLAGMLLYLYLDHINYRSPLGPRAVIYLCVAAFMALGAAIGFAIDKIFGGPKK